MRVFVASILLLAAFALESVRCSSAGKEVLLAIDADSQVQFFLPELYRWLNATSMPGPERHLPAMAVLNNEVYICGGQTISQEDTSKREVLQTCVKYLTWTNTWKVGDDAVAPMLSARYDFAMAATGGKLYAVGGNDNPLQDGSHLFEVYDPALNSWQRLLMFLKEPLWKPTMVGLRGNLYLTAFDGRTKQPLPTPYQYSPELNAWIALRPLCPVRAGVALIADESRGLLYAAGGSTQDVYSPVDVIERYNVSQEQSWWVKPNPADRVNLRSPRTGTPLSGVKVEDRLYVVGGFLPRNAGNRNFSGAAEYMTGDDGATFKSTAAFWDIPGRAVGVPVNAVSVRYPESFIVSFEDREVLLGLDSNNQVQFYIPEFATWHQVSTMPGSPRYYPGVAVVLNVVYVCGGLSKTTYDVLSDCLKYNAWRNEWDRSVAPMLSPRYDFAMAEAGWKIYAIGGSVPGGNNRGSNLFEVYNPDQNRWSSLLMPDYLSDPLWKPSLASYGEYLYMVAFNGRTKQPLDHPYIYYVRLDLWSRLDALSPPRAGVALIMDRTRRLLYAAGGSTQGIDHPVNLVERYDVAGGRQPWQRPADDRNGVQLNSNRTGSPMSGVMVEDRLYIVGGEPDPYVKHTHQRVVEYLSGQDGKTFREGSNFQNAAGYPSEAEVVAVAVRYHNAFIQKFIN